MWLVPAKLDIEERFVTLRSWRLLLMGLPKLVLKPWWQPQSICLVPKYRHKKWEAAFQSHGMRYKDCCYICVMRYTGCWEFCYYPVTQPDLYCIFLLGKVRSFWQIWDGSSPLSFHTYKWGKHSYFSLNLDLWRCSGIICMRYKCVREYNLLKKTQMRDCFITSIQKYKWIKEQHYLIKNFLFAFLWLKNVLNNED